MTDKIKHGLKNIEEIKAQFKALLEDIKSLDKNDLKSLGKEYYKELKDVLHVEEMKDSMNHSLEELEGTIQKSPLRSAAVCLGIGFVLAKVCSIWKSG